MTVRNHGAFSACFLSPVVIRPIVVNFTYTDR